jgi:TonB-dependent receptor
MRRIFFLLLIGSILFTNQLLFAGSGTIQGKVYDEDGLSLAGANVSIPSMKIGSSSDQNGEFNLTGIPVGEYELSVNYIGYQTYSSKVEIVENTSTTILIELKSGVIEGEQIVIVGERLKGQAKALNQQKNNPNITNIVSADQIGRFPDANIGDALKRIAAISVNYDQGEARFVNIRGTEPRLNSIMINDERIPSAEAGIRNVQVDLIPSETIQTIEVHKAVTPDMDADAIGGSVNLISRGAPNNLRVSGTMGSGYNFLSEKPMVIGSFVLANRFLNNRLGIVASASYHDHKLGSDNTEGIWGNFDGVISPQQWEVREYQIRRLRQSFSGALDFQLAPAHTLYLKGMYNHRNDWENRYRLRIRDISAPDSAGNVSVKKLERQTKGGINNDENDNTRLEDQRTSSFRLSGDHLLAGKIKATWSASYAKASEERPNERYLNWELKPGKKDPPIQFRLDNSNPEHPYFAPLNPADIAYEKFKLKELSEERQYTEEIDRNARLDLGIPVISSGPYKNSLKFGARLRDKDKKRDNDFFVYEPVSGFENMTSIGNKDYTNRDFLAGDYEIGRFTTAEDLGRLDLSDTTRFKKSDVPGEYAPENFEASETILAGYTQLNQRVGENLDIIAGVRFEQTNIDYKGNEFIEEDEDGNENIVKPTSGSENYLNVLPGLHATYRFGDRMNLRFAWTNTIARPNYYDLVPYRKISGVTEELAIGNSTLKPTTSMNFDLMAEHYFESIGILSAGIFYKDINDFIYVHAEDDYADPVSGKTYDEFFQPRNGATASLIGLEFAFQRRLDFMPGILRNLNMYANYTYTSSKADNPALNEQVEGSKDIALPGSAPHTLNTALTYDDSRLVLGVTFNYTSPYLDPDEMDLTPGLERYYDKVTYLDLTGSFAITKQVRFFFEANNLLNQPLRYYAGISERTYQAEYYNRRITTGIKFDL